MPNFAKQKGSRGEREFCRYIYDLLDLPILPQRNLEQVRSGGADILGVGPFMFEVKRVEKLNLRKAWIQVKAASKHNPALVPVVVFRYNNGTWKSLISGTYVGLKAGFLQLDTQETEQWLKLVYRRYVERGA